MMHRTPQIHQLQTCPIRQENHLAISLALQQPIDPDRLTHIASGCFASVYEHPFMPDKVIKVARHSPCYLEYISWAFAHQDNPYVPKIDSITLLPGCDVVVVMEKLQPQPRHQVVVQCERFEWRDTSIPAVAEVWDCIRSIVRQFYQCDGERDHDCYGNNVLSRNGHPVITDPVAG